MNTPFALRSGTTHYALLICALACLPLSACGGGGGGSAPKATLPSFAAATFTNPSAVTNPLWTFPADTSLTFASDGSDEPETIVIERLPGTRMVMGLACAIVRDRVYVDGLLIEDTEDWYAQDDNGDVWYMGENVLNYEYDADGNLLSTSTEGSWEAGLDPLGTGSVASPGIAMYGAPQAKAFYYQEFYKGVAEDTGKILAVAAAVQLSDGSTYTCVKTEDNTKLAKNAKELKYFAPNVGFVLETDPKGKERLEYRGRFLQDPSSLPLVMSATFSAPTLIDHPLLPMTAELAAVHVSHSTDPDADVETIVVERLPGIRTVMGIDCAKVRDRVFADGLLIEDTEDWYAQDDAGNVWYMGEFVVNYEYDENGNLTGSNNNGSWEAGLDVAGVGSIAQPGHQLPALPAAGNTYYQEYYVGEAEDMGRVIATNVTVQLADGSVKTGCARTLDWNPLDPDGLEYKIFAPGEGLVLEQALHENATVSLTGTFDRSLASIPNLAGATFTDSTLIDNPLFPLPMGASWDYEAETEDGTETVQVDVLPATRVVAGVTCVVVRDQVFLDGVLIEDTHDWYAQDDAGNVWYFGEDVVNYVYGPNGMLLGTNTNGSWEAGLDVAGVGSVAQPGFQMPATPAAGMVYYQEFYPTAAEDMGRIVATNVKVKIPGTPAFEGCLKTLDWNPLQGDGLEYKYYAPGIGLILEQEVNGEERLELTGTSL